EATVLNELEQETAINFISTGQALRLCEWPLHADRRLAALSGLLREPCWCSSVPQLQRRHLLRPHARCTLHRPPLSPPGPRREVAELPPVALNSCRLRHSFEVVYHFHCVRLAGC